MSIKNLKVLIISEKILSFNTLSLFTFQQLHICIATTFIILDQQHVIHLVRTIYFNPTNFMHLFWIFILFVLSTE